METYKIRFDASMSEEHHGACFDIVCRDWNHAKQVSSWLMSKTDKKFICVTLETVTQTTLTVDK